MSTQHDPDAEAVADHSLVHPPQPGTTAHPPATHTRYPNPDHRAATTKTTVLNTERMATIAQSVMAIRPYSSDFFIA